MCFGIDSSVILDSVHLLAVRSDLGDGIRRCGLQTLNELVYDINEDDLEAEMSILSSSSDDLAHLKARYTQLLRHEATANVATAEMDSFETHTGRS